MGCAAATDLLSHFHSALMGFQLNTILQVSMNGPNVNWKFLEHFQSELKRNSNATPVVECRQRPIMVEVAKFQELLDMSGRGKGGKVKAKAKSQSSHAGR